MFLCATLYLYDLNIVYPMFNSFTDLLFLRGKTYITLREQCVVNIRYLFVTTSYISDGKKIDSYDHFYLAAGTSAICMEKCIFLFDRAQNSTVMNAEFMGNRSDRYSSISIEHKFYPIFDSITYLRALIITSMIM